MHWLSLAAAATGQLDGTFSNIEIVGPCRVVLLDAEPPGARWKTDAGELSIVIDGHTLKVSSDGDLKNCVIDVRHGSLSKIAASSGAMIEVGTLQSNQLDLVALGAASIVVQGLKVDRLKIDAAGSSTITVHEGRVRFHKARVSGASFLFADNVRADAVEIEVSASSAADVGVVQTLNAKATGSSVVRYVGKPTIRHAKADFTSTVTGP